MSHKNLIVSNDEESILLRAYSTLQSAYDSFKEKTTIQLAPSINSEQFVIQKLRATFELIIKKETNVFKQ